MSVYVSQVLQNNGLFKVSMPVMCVFSARSHQLAKMTRELLGLLRHQGCENCDQERHRDLRSHNLARQQEVLGAEKRLCSAGIWVMLIHVNNQTSCKAGLLVFLFWNIKYYFDVCINSNQIAGGKLLSIYDYLSFPSEYFDFCWLIFACVDDHLSKKNRCQSNGFNTKSVTN